MTPGFRLTAPAGSRSGLRRIHPLLGLLLLLPLGVVGCGRDGDEPVRLGTPLASVADSAGVEVVEIDLERARTAARTRPEPDRVVGAGAGEEGSEPALHDVVDARRLDDGTLAVAEGSTQEILLFGPDGGAPRRLGGDGDGPAELRGLTAVFDEGDGRVGAFDARRMRYLVFSKDGELVAHRSLPGAGSGRVRRRFLPLDDGRHLLVRLPTIPDEPAPEGARGTGEVLLVDGEAVDTVARVRGRAGFRGPRGMGLVPFGTNTEVAVGAGGVWIGDTADRSLELRALDGTLRRVVRWRFERPLTLSPARTDSLVDALVDRVPEEARERARERAEALPFPEREPAFGSVLVDAADRVWIGEFVEPEVRLADAPRPPRQWLVLTRRGRPMGMATTPEGLRVTEIGRDWVLGVHTDSLDVETVRLHALGTP